MKETGLFCLFSCLPSITASHFLTHGGNRSSRQKPPPNTKSLATFLHAPDRVPQLVLSDGMHGCKSLTYGGNITNLWKTPFA